MLRVTQLSGFIAGADQGCRVTASLVAEQSNSGNSSLYTFNDVDIGTPHPDRILIVFVAMKSTEVGADVQIDGSSMTLLADEQLDSGGEDLYFGAFTLAYAPGSTADITVDPGSPTATSCHLVVYRIISTVDELPYDIFSDSASSGTSIALTLGTRANGFVMFAASVRDTNAIAWDVGTELYQAAIDVGHSGGILNPSDGSEVTITASWTGSGLNAGIALSWGCASITAQDVGYVFARRNSAQSSIGTTPAVLAHDTDVSDAFNVHSGGTITVPSNWNGLYGMMIGSVQLADAGATRSIYLRAEKAGSPADGQGALSSSTSGQNFLNYVSAPILLTTGDLLTTEIATGASTVDTVASSVFTWGSLFTMPASFSGVLLKKAAGQSIGSTLTAAVFGAEVYDLDAFHSNVTNTSRITVPSGVTLMQFAACAKCATSGSQVYIQLYKNGAAVDGGFAADTDGGSLVSVVSALSAPIACVAGDYFECMVSCQTTQTFPVDANNWFAGWVLDPATEYALVKRTSNTSVNGGVNVTWQSELVDSGGYYSAGSPTRLTASGAGRYLLIGNAGSTGGGSAQFVLKFQNSGGETMYGLAERDNISSGDDFNNIVSAVLDLTGTEYFELNALQTSGSFIGDERGWFCLMKLAGL